MGLAGEENPVGRSQEVLSNRYETWFGEGGRLENLVCEVTIGG